MRIVLFEDHLTAENRPITLPRPAFAVSLAGARLYDVAASRATSVSAVIRGYLAEAAARDFPLAPLSATPTAEDVLFLNASLAPSFDTVDHLLAERAKGDFLVQDDSRVVAAYCKTPPAGLANLTEQTITGALLGLPFKPLREELPLVTFPHDLVRCHQKFFNANLAHLTRGLRELRPGVFAGEGVKIHETAVLQADDGPIVIGDKVSIGPFALLIGPLIIGANSKIIERATVKEQVQIGHTCKIGGEIECAVIEPHTNKQHHGFLGHAYVGSWVNLGAGTSNSDLKNTYGEVAILHRGRRVNTGMQFLGCTIGDYTKSAINTSIFTGKIIGVSSHLYGFVGTNVPSFTNYARSFDQETEVLLEAAVKTQQRMFARRKITQTAADIKLLENMYEFTRDERLMSTDPLTF